jgi:hypothetical protein
MTLAAFLIRLRETNEHEQMPLSRVDGVPSHRAWGSTASSNGVK